MKNEKLKMTNGFISLVIRSLGHYSFLYITTALLFITVLFTSQVFAIEPWTELWNRGGYQTTNFESAGFSSALLRSQGLFGVHLIPIGWTFIDPYVAYYGVYSQNTAYWNNNLIYGVGVRIRPFLGCKRTSWADEWLPDLKVFSESLNIQYLQNKDQAVTEGTKTIDSRYGIDIWHEWNLDKPNTSIPWGELWANLSYHTTNFQSAWADSLYGSFKDSYLLYFQPKIGIHLGRRAEPYVKAELVSSAQPFSWLNNIAYGLGIRIEPFRDDEKNIFRKLKIFLEYMKISYSKSSSAEDPPPSQKPENDIRIGFDLPYGL